MSLVVGLVTHCISHCAFLYVRNTFKKKKSCVAFTLGDSTNLGPEKETGELISHPSLSQRP